jgi:hypothetical protein
MVQHGYARQQVEGGPPLPPSPRPGGSPLTRLSANPDQGHDDKLRGVKVVATDEVREWVIARGGELYVSTHRQACCSGGIVLLETTSDAPSDLDGFRSFQADGFSVWLRCGHRAPPDELSLDMRGLFRRSPHAYWDRCIYVP